MNFGCVPWQRSFGMEVKMYTSDINTVSQAAANKADMCNKKLGKFFIRSIMAGFYIVVAVLLSNITAAVLYPTYPQFAKIAGAVLFSIAIILIVFIGGELFTGNNMTMALGVYNRSCKIIDLIKVWVISYIGNFVGAFVFSGIFVASGASKQIITDYFNTFMTNKLSISPMELFLRGILCNFLVCLSVWTGTRMKTESGKIIVMMCVIMTFIISGFEHCIANMGIFSMGYMLLDGLEMLLIMKSMFFVTLGNMVGGAVMLALPLKLMSDEK